MDETQSVNTHPLENQRNTIGIRRRPQLWELYVPFAVAAVPAALFALLGWWNREWGLDKPGGESPAWFPVAVAAVMIPSFTAMAVVILSRKEFAERKLLRCSDGRPAGWRQLCVLLSIGCLISFDILANVATAFSGTQFLLVAAIPAFGGYVFFGRAAFVGLRQCET